MCRKRSDGRGGRWVRFGSIYRSECPSRPIPPFSGPTKKKEKKRRAVPLSWEMTRKLSVKEREQEEDEREREEICIYRECFCSCVLTPREGGGGLGGRIIREMTGLLFFPHTTKKKKRKNPSIEKSLSEPSPPEKKKGRRGEREEEIKRSRGKPRESKNSPRMGNRICWQRGRLSSPSVCPSATRSADAYQSRR